MKVVDTVYAVVMNTFIIYLYIYTYIIYKMRIVAIRVTYKKLSIS